MALPAAPASVFAWSRRFWLLGPLSLASSPRSPQRQVRRVLVVDDDPDILSTLAAMLGSMLGVPVEVSTASTADEAKRRMEQGEWFDLVLSDERMPGMKGSELLAWIRETQPATARVLMSAFYAGHVASDLQERAGAEAFIQKPFQLQPMLDQLRRMLGEPTG